jgi:hypothetical protein
MKESSFWAARLRPKLVSVCQELKLPHHFERVENAVSAGTPDVDYCVGGAHGKIELKFSPRHPTRLETTPVLGRQEGLRRSQVIWITRRLRAGGRVFVMIGTPQETWLVNVRGWRPVDLENLDRLTVLQLRFEAAWCSHSSPWLDLPKALREATEGLS